MRQDCRVQWVADPLLLEQLRGAERLRGEPRSLRVARHPGRRLLPLALARRNDVLLRRVRTFYGAELLVALPDPVALSLYRYGSYDSATSAFLLHAVREGDCVLDAGAHVGYFTLLASRLAGAKGRVAAFEPNEFTRGLLRRNAVGSANIEVVGRAVGAGAASTTFRVRVRGHRLCDAVGRRSHSWRSGPVMGRSARGIDVARRLRRRERADAFGHQARCREQRGGRA